MIFYDFFMFFFHLFLCVFYDFLWFFENDFLMKFYDIFMKIYDFIMIFLWKFVTYPKASFFSRYSLL